jgi:hypothetical protein
MHISSRAFPQTDHKENPIKTPHTTEWRAMSGNNFRVADGTSWSFFAMEFPTHIRRIPPRSIKTTNVHIAADTLPRNSGWTAKNTQKSTYMTQE